MFVNLAGLVQIASLPSIHAGKVKAFLNALMEESAPLMATHVSDGEMVLVQVMTKSRRA